MNYHPIQRILVPLDTSSYSRAATLRACEVARMHDSQVTGLVVLDTPDIAGTVLPGELTYWPIVQDTIENLTADARERITDAQDDFGKACGEMGVTHTESQLSGVPAAKILEASLLYDLVVMGLRSYFHFETREGPGDSLERVLGRTVTPVLAVPQEQEPAAFRKVAVAFDGSFSAGRALRDFAAFAKPYDFEITVVTAQEEAKQAQHLLEEAAAYLRAHEIENFETLHVEKPHLSGSATQLIEEADLVVAGIHASHFIKDLFVGSFTREMIDRGDKALFMSH